MSDGDAMREEFGEPRLSGHEALKRARERMDDAIIAPASGNPVGWAEGLRDALDGLAVVLREHSEEAEAPGGSLEEMAELAPHLLFRINHARAEHPALIRRTVELREDAASQIATGQVETPRLRSDAGRLQGDVRHHMAAGVDLIFEAYDRDLGGEG